MYHRNQYNKDRDTSTEKAVASFLGWKNPYQTNTLLFANAANSPYSKFIKPNVSNENAFILAHGREINLDKTKAVEYIKNNIIRQEDLLDYLDGHVNQDNTVQTWLEKHIIRCTDGWAGWSDRYRYYLDGDQANLLGIKIDRKE